MYIHVRDINEINDVLFVKLINLYHRDPITHVYLFHDMIYEPETIKYMVIEYSDSDIISYAFRWRKYSADAIHVWSKDKCVEPRNIFMRDILRGLSRDAIIHIYTLDNECINRITEYLKGKGIGVRRYIYHDMIVDEESFKPYYPEKARRLGLGDLEFFIKVKEIQARELYGFKRKITRGEAEGMLLHNRYYGVFVDGKLVAIASRYLALRDISVIGDVYTLPNYRGQGYGKIVSSAITRDVVGYGAKALLHVRKDNTIAINLYRRLGYRTIGSRTWLFIEKIS
jgi:GNAT superfamily N-acetyltransferase